MTPFTGLLHQHGRRIALALVAVLMLASIACIYLLDVSAMSAAGAVATQDGAETADADRVEFVEGFGRLAMIQLRLTSIAWILSVASLLLTLWLLFTAASHPSATA